MKENYHKRKDSPKTLQTYFFPIVYQIDTHGQGVKCANNLQIN